MKTTVRKGLRIAAAWTLLGAILACGGSDDDDAPPPVAPVAPSGTPTPTGAPTAPSPTPPPPPQPGQPAVATTNLSLTPGFMPDPQTARGQAGGNVPSNSLDPSCSAGRLPTAPQHALTLTSSFSNLRIMVNSQHDTTLAIRQPDGTYRCNDDGVGLDPLIEGAFGPGTYQIYVGTFTGTAEPYVIGFSELSSVTPDSLGAP